MGFILIALLLIAVVWLIGACICISRTASEKKIIKVCTIISIALFVVLGGIGLFSPPSEYEEEKIEEVIELERFTHDTISKDNGFCYLTVEYGNRYVYYTKTEEGYKSNLLVSDNVMIVESNMLDKATVTIYSSKAKKSLWTFALGHDEYKYEYLFFVPFATVLDLDRFH